MPYLGFIRIKPWKKPLVAPSSPPVPAATKPAGRAVLEFVLLPGVVILGGCELPENGRINMFSSFTI